MPCLKAIYCRCACALRVWMSMFFRVAVSDYILCVLVRTQAAAGTLAKTSGLTPQDLNTDVRACIV